jgi:hypothetical protein
MNEDFSRQVREIDAVWQKKAAKAAYCGCEFRF